MWNDIKTFFKEAYDHLNFLLWWVIAFVGVTYYLGLWSGVCNKVGCTLMLK